MSNLNKCRLKDIAVSQTGPFGSQLHEKDYVQYGTPIVTVEHLGGIGFIRNNLPMVSDQDKARLAKYTLKEGDIVFSRVGSIDRCTYVSKQEEGWLFSGRCLRVRINEKANAKFISYYFRQQHFKKMMLNISVGATMPSLNTSLMDNIPLYLPDKIAQQQIAAILSALDAKIDLNNHINAELEAMAKTLYDFWFVQFDFPDKNGKPYKSSGGKMVWNKELKREIPAGWDATQLRQYVSLERGVTYGKEDVYPADTRGAIGVLRATNITGNILDIDDLVYVSDNKVSSSQILTQFETLIVMSSGSKEHIGKNGIYYFDNPLGFGAFCSKITSCINSRSFVNTFLQTNWFKAYIKNQCLGTNINNLTNDHINSCPIIKPDNKILCLFGDTVESFYKRIANNTLENHSLKHFRDWLLPMLMNGQVKVS